MVGAGSVEVVEGAVVDGLVVGGSLVDVVVDGVVVDGVVVDGVVVDGVVVEGPGAARVVLLDVELDGAGGGAEVGGVSAVSRGGSGSAGRKARAAGSVVTAAMKSRQMRAGMVPPVTFRTPSTPCIGTLPSGNPTQTAVDSAGV